MLQSANLAAGVTKKEVSRARGCRWLDGWLQMSDFRPHVGQRPGTTFASVSHLREWAPTRDLHRVHSFPFAQLAISERGPARDCLSSSDEGRAPASDRVRNSASKKPPVRGWAQLAQSGALTGEERIT